MAMDSFYYQISLLVVYCGYLTHQGSGQFNDDKFCYVTRAYWYVDSIFNNGQMETWPINVTKIGVRWVNISHICRFERPWLGLMDFMKRLFSDFVTFRMVQEKKSKSVGQSTLKVDLHGKFFQTCWFHCW